MITTVREPITLVSDFEELLKSIYDIEHIISSDEYRERRKSTLSAYQVVINICEPFLKATKDIEAANSIGIPDYGKALCFPYRFLKKPSTTAIPNQAGEPLSEVLDGVFFTGLNFHFFWATFPTRERYDQVDITALKESWLRGALIADRTMGNFYHGEGGQMAKNLFDVYYSNMCEAVLTKEIKIGFLKRGGCKSFFKNIYWAGALLGVQYDMATK